MPTPKSIAAILGDNTKVKILKTLAEEQLTTTELFKKLPEIRYRESVFKALKKLEETGLVRKRFIPKLRGYRYFSAFKQIRIDRKMQVKIVQ
jgi:DNA-binding transcriptional ArsR family regulator